jgi:hypothetical protein
MSDWIHSLPVALMAVVVFGLLSPLGVIFGLMVAFLAAQVWGDAERANTAVNHQASALRGAVLLSYAIAPEPGQRIRELIRNHIHEARTVEWPAMAKKNITLSLMPAYLTAALQTALRLRPQNPGEATAQKEIVTALENALEARRQTILVSRVEVNWVKWLCLFIQAICTLVTIAMVHSDSRPTSRIALGLFSTAIGICILLLAAHDRPFTGQLAVSSAPLLNVTPDSSSTAPVPRTND